MNTETCKKPSPDSWLLHASASQSNVASPRPDTQWCLAMPQVNTRDFMRHPLILGDKPGSSSMAIRKIPKQVALRIQSLMQAVGDLDNNAGLHRCTMLHHNPQLSMAHQKCYLADSYLRLNCKPCSERSLQFAGSTPNDDS